MSLQDKIKQYVGRNCGQITRFDPPIYDPNTRQHIVNIKAKYPVYIFDDRDPSNYKVRILNIDSVGKIVFNDKEELVPPLTSSWEQLNDNLESKLRLWREQTENIVVSCSSDQFVKIGEFRHHLRQIVSLLDTLLEYGKITKTDLTKFITLNEKQRLMQYVNLLEGLDIVRPNNNYFEPGNTFVGIEKGSKNSREILLSYILKNRYVTLRDSFELTIFEKTVGIDNVIYIPELEIEDEVHRTKNNILTEYKKHYGKNMNPLKLNSILRMLEESGAINRHNEHYFGVDELREKMIKEKEKYATIPLSKYK